MKRRRFAALAGASLLLAIGAPAMSMRGSAHTTARSGAPAAWLDGDGGQFAGVAVADDGAIVLTAQDAAWSEAPYARAGAFLGPRLPLAEPTATLAARWEGESPEGAAVRLEVRGWEGERPTPWEEVPAGGGGVTLAWPASAAQYRVSLLAMPDAAGPVVRGVWVAPVGEAAPPTLAAAQAQPSAAHRLYATRIGLIGRTTANGTIIAPEDRFVALPSRRVLAARGSRDYEARIEYKGRSVAIPVWDIGPWNVRDNYWDSSHRRDMWNDLPPGRPQSAAAYYEAYNGGRDGFGRRILSPASIDISDAAFYELGMTGADWVNVTLLWQAGR
jgi:hypothetical protein